MKRVLPAGAQLAHAAVARLVTAAPPPAQQLARRAFSGSRASAGMEEFFPPALKEGETPKHAGRAWEASELRLKSRDDLHKLWFLCLKERNLLLTERLYYRQVGQAAPEADRLLKVKMTMARIKVVIGERARAAEALERDKRLLGKLTAAAAGEGQPPAAAQPAVRLSGKLVTYKKFGRSFTVPVERAPAAPTRQQKKVAAKNARYWARVKSLRAQMDAHEAAVGYAATPNASAIGGGSGNLRGLQ